MADTMRFTTLVLAGSFAAGMANAQTATLRPEAQPPEDPKLRAEAVSLLERANCASTPVVWPANEMRLRFRVPNPAPGEAVEGEYIGNIARPGLFRQEWRYGAFQSILTRNGQRVSVSPHSVPKPAIVGLLPKLTPISLGRFDQQDIIRSIAAGTDGSRCIQFDTVFGDRQQMNEICLDAQHGWLLSIRLGDETTRNSNFFAFQGAYFPGHIERWVGNSMLIEIDQTVIEKNDYPPDFFSVPESTDGFICQDFRRAYAENTPQPPPQGSSAAVDDVALLGMIGPNGHVFGLKAINQARPDLNDEAIKLVSTWTFAPATCGGKPVAWETTFTIHFKGR